MKLVLGVLILLCVAFALSRCAAERNEEDSAGKDAPEWIASLGEQFRQPFDLRDLRPVACLDRAEGLVTAAPACSVVVSGRKKANRVLRVRLRQGSLAIVDFQPAPGDESGLPSHARKLTAGAERAATTVVVPPVGGSWCFSAWAALRVARCNWNKLR